MNENSARWPLLTTVVGLGMKPTVPAFLLIFLAACAEQVEDPVLEMTTALTASNNILALQLISIETLAYTAEDPDRRHGPSCPCPCLELTPTGETQLDYAETGCLPKSGLIPTVLAGHLSTEPHGASWTATFENVLIGLKHSVDGTVEGSVITAHGGTRLDLSIDIEAAGFSLQSRTDATIGLEALRLTAAGTLDGRPFWLEHVELPFDSVLGECPRPSQGRFGLEDPVVVGRYSSPVHLEAGGQEATGEICDYRGSVF